MASRRATSRRSRPGLGFHIPKGYLYFAIAFPIPVGMLNLAAARRRKARRQQEVGAP